MGVKGGMEVTLKAGETFHEGPDDVHTVGHNASTTNPARTTSDARETRPCPCC